MNASIVTTLAVTAFETAANVALGAAGRARLAPFAGARAAIVVTSPPLRMVVRIGSDRFHVSLADAAATDAAEAAVEGDLPAVIGHFIGAAGGPVRTRGDVALLGALVACAGELPSTLVAPLAPLTGVSAGAAIEATIRAGGAAFVDAARAIADVLPRPHAMRANGEKL